MQRYCIIFLLLSGATTFPGLRKFIADNSQTRVLSLLHIAAHGLAATGCTGWVKGGECDSLNQVNSELCVECINQNRDMIVGVKVRLSASAANDGVNEKEAFRNCGKCVMRHKRNIGFC
ncbi:hypothetical protein OS493_018786 [Desmophyllum pertusum]|uniref:Uncharacterized protein n=1 Tax=Desmophyllum pertusum TaxID=174260 RepID=A0A9W9ZC59_9CNID|nr:hypothetical protein OS493_018786 [Desmophyllum pertusum]